MGFFSRKSKKDQPEPKNAEKSSETKGQTNFIAEQSRSEKKVFMDEAKVEKIELGDKRPKTPEGFPFETFLDLQNPFSSNEIMGHQIILIRHNIKLVDKSADISQVYPWLVDCSCGFQGRCFNKSEAFAIGERHVGHRLEV